MRIHRSQRHRDGHGRSHAAPLPGTVFHDQRRSRVGPGAGIEAFLDALKSGKPFPVVKTDLGMPQVDGRAVTAAIKAATPSTFVVMLTGWGRRLVATGEFPDGVVAPVQATQTRP
jgi:CheY-like chemotaxis protein